MWVRQAGNAGEMMLHGETAGLQRQDWRWFSISVELPFHVATEVWRECLPDLPPRRDTGSHGQTCAYLDHASFYTECIFARQFVFFWVITGI